MYEKLKCGWWRAHSKHLYVYSICTSVHIFCICEGCYGQSVHAGIPSFGSHDAQPRDNMFLNIAIYANDLLNCLISIKAMLYADRKRECGSS